MSMRTSDNLIVIQSRVESCHVVSSGSLAHCHANTNEVFTATAKPRDSMIHKLAGGGSGDDARHGVWSEDGSIMASVMHKDFRDSVK